MVPTANAPQSLHDRVAEVMEAIRPMIQADGGDVELVSVRSDGCVEVRLLGACVGCPSAQMTLKAGLEQNIKARVPEVSAVVALD